MAQVKAFSMPMKNMTLFCGKEYPYKIVVLKKLMCKLSSWVSFLSIPFPLPFQHLIWLEADIDNTNTRYWGIEVLSGIGIGIGIEVFNFAGIGIGIEVLRFWSIEVLRFGVVLVLSRTRYQPPQDSKDSRSSKCLFTLLARICFYCLKVQCGQSIRGTQSRNASSWIAILFEERR